jgi:hypothetical protein
MIAAKSQVIAPTILRPLPEPIHLYARNPRLTPAQRGSVFIEPFPATRL